MGIRGCPPVGAYSWIPESNCLPERSVTQRGSQNTPIPLAMGMMTALGMMTMSASHVIQDEATRATYLDMVTTSVGRVTLSGPEGEIPMLGPEIEDVMDLI